MSDGAYTLVHVMLAGITFAMIMVHVTIWFAVRGERTQVWAAFSCMWYGLLLLAAGITNVATPALPSRLFFFAVVPASAFHVAMLMVILSLFSLPLTAARRAVIGVLAAGCVAIAIERFLTLLGMTGRSPATADELLFHGPFAPLAAAVVIAPLVVWVVESVLVLRRGTHRHMAVAAIVCAAVGIVMLSVFFATGHTRWMMMTGTMLLAFASAMVVSGYVRNARRAERAGEYLLEKRIASGGMGDLYLARKTGPAGFSREVALKRIRPEVLGDASFGFEARFLTEAKISARLSHPNIVAVYDFGKLDEGGWFLAMEFLHGWSLAEIRGKLLEAKTFAPPEMIAALGEQIGRGLAHAHAAGIVHRDMSGQNVVLTRDGIAKIVDFGIAKSADVTDTAIGGPAPGGAAAGTLTLPGKVMGKLGYLAPEQLRGAAATPLVDVYATGVVLYELATGTRPFRPANDPQAIPRAELWRPARASRPDLPDALDAALTRALAWNVEDRFTSAAEMAEAFRRVSGALPYADLGGWARGLLDAAPAVAETATAPLPAPPDDEHTRPSAPRG